MPIFKMTHYRPPAACSFLPLIYVMMQWGQEGAHGWGIVMATDTAFVIGCLAILGRRIPQSLRVFMLSLAIVDDIGAILVVAIGYGGSLDFAALAFGGLGIAIVLGMGRLGIRSIPIYFLVGGLIWLAVDASGIHATVTGVILGLLTPTQRWVGDERLRAILDRVVAYPADHWSAIEDRKALRLAEVAARRSRRSSGWKSCCTPGWGSSSCRCSRSPMPASRYLPQS